MEVRCCCDAGRLLGHLPDPTGNSPKMSFQAGDKVVEFEVEFVHVPGRLPHRAYKSKDYPMELLRKISQFEECE